MAAAGMAATGPGAKPASSARVTKLALYLLHRMRVTTRDGRQLVGGLIGFDKHLNLVLKDCEEFKHLPKKGGEQRRVLGLVLLRGEEVVSMTVEGPPPAQEARNKAAANAGPGAGRAAGRGLPLQAPQFQAAPGLRAPAPGLGAPGAAQMQPGPRPGMPPPGYQPGVGRGMPPPGMPPPRMPPPGFRPGMPPPGMPPPGMPPPGMPPPGFQPGMPPPGMPPPGMPPPGFMPPGGPMGRGMPPPGGPPGGPPPQQ